ncbi:hypothetical protein [Paenarthrobacter sp. A20]|uniref:hypothetical protein n=1 Tax=Paenarthrobacter sp. A20 TaxID=2817891 RepID=UPI00209F68D2|nr:hypothetical protein [Paenarthrobacter sp. A20]MCP1410985.1 hypothetical protein [Paenarthrobacter sp. A20]
MRDSSAPKRAEQAPQYTPRHYEPQRAEHAPQHTPQRNEPRHYEPRPIPQAQPQGHPSAVGVHTPAPPVNGTWPELTPRPAHTTTNTQPAPLTPLENAMSRQARLHDEHLAV